MSVPLIIAGVTALANLAGNYFQGKAQQEAAQAQSETMAGAAQAGIDVQQQQFQAIQDLITPYTEAGTQALQQQQALAGTLGAEAQQQAINQLQQSPQFQSMIQQGEEAILQGASATGGLRGGNVQGALAQFRPQVLSDVINQQYAQLGGLSGQGLAGAQTLSAAGQNQASNISNLLMQQGQAQAMGQQPGFDWGSNILSALTGGLGTYTGLGGTFGGTSVVSPGGTNPGGTILSGGLTTQPGTAIL